MLQVYSIFTIRKIKNLSAKLLIASQFLRKSNRREDLVLLRKKTVQEKRRPKADAKKPTAKKKAPAKAKKPAVAKKTAPKKTTAKKAGPKKGSAKPNLQIK